MVAFYGYINELYKKDEGILLGYKVQEELEIASITGTYHTLWFNIWDISGINNIKVTDKSDANESSKSTVDVYLNDSTTLLSPTYNKKAFVKTSQKYDVELRSRYYYSLVDDDVESTEVEISMMMIQDDNDVDTNYSDFSTDFKKDNNLDVSVSLSYIYLAKIRDDYNTLIPTFKENLDAITYEVIQEYLNLFY